MILEFAFVADGKFGGIAERDRQSRAGFDAEPFHRVARRDIAGMIGQDDRAVFGVAGEIVRRRHL